MCCHRRTAPWPACTWGGSFPSWGPSLYAAGMTLTLRRSSRAAVYFTSPATSAKSVWSFPTPTFSPARRRVPRWRTSTVPASTREPANSFTPSRWPAESRPLRVEPAPFLCAISYASIFVIRSVVSDWRWPRPRRWRVLFLYRRTWIFGPFPWATISAVTFAPPSAGVPAFTSSPSAMTRMSPSVTVSPTLPARLSTLRRVPSSTRYCLPPLRTMAYIGNSDHPDRKSRRARARRMKSISYRTAGSPRPSGIKELGPRGCGDCCFRAHQAHEIGGDAEQGGQAHDRRDERDRVRERLRALARAHYEQHRDERRGAEVEAPEDDVVGPWPEARTIRGGHEDRAEQDVRHDADEVRVIERMHQTDRDLADVTLSRDELLHEDRLEDDRERQETDRDSDVPRTGGGHPGSRDRRASETDRDDDDAREGQEGRDPGECLRELRSEERRQEEAECEDEATDEQQIDLGETEHAPLPGTSELP